MKCYITKYALTSGISIMEILPEVWDDDVKRVYWYSSKECKYKLFFYKGKDIFLDKKDAEKRVEEMIEKSIKSLKNKISRLEKTIIKYKGEE